MNYVKSFTDFLYCLWSDRSLMNSVFLKILAVSLAILLQQSLKNNNRVFCFFFRKVLTSTGETDAAALVSQQTSQKQILCLFF